ncbi:hypothetical protein CEB3_c29740 [Peptococcaceae bacterium CEB3]|nr:hypothetical protein CEB3_c29740 [Peptococcaceae bacterium CEB3]
MSGPISERMAMAVIGLELSPGMVRSKSRMAEKGCTSKSKDVEYENPKLAGRFHTNFDTGEFRKPISQLSKALGKGREASLLILSTAICISKTDAGIDPGFVDIKSTAVSTKDFEQKKYLLQKYL